MRSCRERRGIELRACGLRSIEPRSWRRPPQVIASIVSGSGPNCRSGRSRETSPPCLGAISSTTRFDISPVMVPMLVSGHRLNQSVTWSVDGRALCSSSQTMSGRLSRAQRQNAPAAGQIALRCIDLGGAWHDVVLLRAMAASFGLKRRRARSSRAVDRGSAQPAHIPGSIGWSTAPPVSAQSLKPPRL